MTEGDTPPVDADYVHARLAQLGVPWPRPLVLASTESTNADAMAAAQRGEPEGTSIVADEQTAGRGRMGRTWVSAPGTGLWVSMLVSGPVTFGLGLLPLLAGVSTARAVRNAGVSAALKWPNDVVVDDPAGLRKLSGILCEADGSGNVVVGIGVNVSQTREQLPVPQATSVAIEGGRASRSDLLVDILAGMHQGLVDLRAGRGGLMDDYRALCVTIGRPVTATLPSGEQVTGVATEVSDDGRLAIRTAVKTVYVAAGDVIHATI